MRGSVPLSLLASALPSARAISLARCVYRMTDMQHGDGSYRLAIFDCDFDDDLYLKSRIDGDLAPIPSDSSRDEVGAAISNSSIVSSVPWANFAGLTLMDGAVPNSLFTLSHNVRLRCEHEGISFDLFQKPSHEPPVNFLYSLPPTKNSINTLWQAFGAYKWPEDPLPRRMSVGLMVDAGLISTDDIETCIDGGKLIMAADTSPPEACPDCQFVPLRRGCSEEECSIWHYSDGSGNAIDPLSSVPVEHANNECDLDRFTNFTSERLPRLYDLLETAKTEKESEAAMLSYTTIVNDIEYAACSDIFESFYTTKSASIFMKGVRGCEDPSDETDPCCNERMQWSDCCLPEDKYIEIDGVFNATNLDAINSVCGANGAGVAALLDSEISQVLISASHPEFGCDAAYEKVNPKQGDDSDIYKTLWDDSPVSKCEEEVRWGKSITGQDMCNADQECWSGSCVSYGGSTKRCTNLLGEAIAGPLLRCIAQRLDPKLWKYIAQKLGIDPSKIKRGAELKGVKWDNAVETFKSLVGSPNCVGEEAEQGICAITDMTKEECESVNQIHDWQRRMEWVVDESLVHGGMCKKRNSYWWENDVGIHIHGHTDDVQKECQAIFDAMQGACVDSTMPKGRHWFKSQEECTGETESWFSFASHTVVGHRLVSQRIWMLDDETGNWAEAFREGDEHACSLQTTCNWDPDNYITSGDEDLCLDPSPLGDTTYPRASFEEDGTPMACLQCWGSRCEDFWSASPPICAVSPHDHDDCAQKSGGGPNNDSPVSAMTIEGHDSHMKCRRNNLKTEAECLPPDFCPLPYEEDPRDEWAHHCAESSCWDLTKTEHQCHYDHATKIGFGWRSEYRGGAGACKVEYDHEKDTHFEKSNCEEAGHTWWEGRAFKSGSFNTADECTQYCNDGTWPIKKTCTSGSCNEPCAQCVVGDSWRFPEGAACYLTDEIDRDTCFSLGDYEWDWGMQMCYRKNFVGNEADCSDLDGSGSDDDYFFSMSMSMSMSMMTSEPGFDWAVGDEQNSDPALTHKYVSCPAQNEDTCAAYCWAKDHGDWESCYDEGLEWDWSLSRCKHPTWRVNKPSSPTCESYTADIDENTPRDHTFWEKAEKCWSNGCHFDYGALPTCSGQGSGCAEQDGNTEWFDGGDEDTAAAKLLLGCHWDLWRPCPSEETCLEAGECEDWFLNEGRCVVPIEPNEWGHRKGCHEMTHPVDGTWYEWAEKLGCVARVSDRHVKESECDSVGGTWHVRAKSKEQCEDDRGDVCTHPFDEWRIFGGIESEEKCESCGYKITHPTKWRTGVWSDSAETPLYWVERAFSPKNKWEENSFDSEAFHSLVRNSISRYVADAFKRKVYCELSAYNVFIPAIISMCHAEGDNGQSVVKYDLTTSQVSCGDLQDQPPMETYEGSISYANAECTNSSDTFAEATMGKVVPLGSSRRRMTSSNVCSQHEIITNSYGELVGQKLGSGLSFTGVDNATVCIKPTVPDSEICSKYVEFGISIVDDSGSYSVPLSASTSENAQGELCFDGSVSGVTYAPVKLMSGWKTAGANTTQSPTELLASQSPSTSPTKDLSEGYSNSPTGSPSVSYSSAPSAATSDASLTAPSTAPSDAPSAAPSTAPSTAPSASPTKTGTTKSPTISPMPSSSLSSEPSLDPTTSAEPSAVASVEPSLKPSTSASAEPSLNPTVSEHPTASAQPTNSLKPSLLQSSTPSLLSPSMEPSVPLTMAPTKAGTGTVEVSFDVSVKLNGLPSVSDLSVISLNSITRLLEKVFSSLVPPGAIIRLLKVGGVAVARRLVRFLEEVDSSGVDVEFEVTMTQQCDTAACDDSEVISSTLYDQVTTNLKAKVDDGNMARVIQEEATSEGVAELTNITISSFQASEATVKVEKAQVDRQPTDVPTVAPTADSASTVLGNNFLMTIVVALPLLGACFGTN